MTMIASRPESQDKFYFYHSVFDPLRLIDRNVDRSAVATPGYVTNAFGVRIDPRFLPTLLKDRAGELEPPPVPANWHADLAEFGAALRAVELANDTFTMIELGCGWGCWMNITGRVAKSRGLEVRLLGVEGDEGHLEFAKQSLQANGFSAKEYEVMRGIAAAEDGFALFPRQERAGVSWALEPVFGVSEDQAAIMVSSGNYDRLPQIALERIAGPGDRVDLLHVDIQGGEDALIPACLSFLTQRVAYLLIGTHSRQIEGRMLDCLLGAGWVLEMERPAVLTVGEHVSVVVDGVQGWRNPHLIPHDKAARVAQQGSVVVLKTPQKVAAGESFRLTVEIENASISDWTDNVDYPVKVSYHWVAKHTDTRIFEGLRTSLQGGVLQAGHKVRQDIEVMAPEHPGMYELQVTLIQEWLRWFDEPEFSSAIVEINIAQR
jgi:hypothetical protein